MIEHARFPQRKFLPDNLGDDLPRTDCGFLNSSASERTLGLQDLLRFRAVLIKAPPWLGKTYVSNGLDTYLRISKEKPSDLKFDHCHFTNFEQRYDGIPTWWEKWQCSQGRACWIINAVDEDFRDGKRNIFEVLSTIKRLNSSEHERLTVLCFCRQAEIDKGFLKEFKEAAQEVFEVRLTILGEVSARECVEEFRLEKATGNTFEAICDFIKQNHLQDVAGYPVVLRHLVNRNLDLKANEGEVWRGVIRDMLLTREDGSDGELDLRFQAAQRAAAVLILSGLHGWETPNVSIFFPETNPHHAKLRLALEKVTKTTLTRTTAVSTAFAQRHVQEWLAAFALAELSRTRLRGILPQGKAIQLTSMLALLGKATYDEGVRKLVREQCGGLPPRSDAASWDVHDALEWLNRLQALAKLGGWYWREHDPDQLRQMFDIPRIRRLLASRVSKKSLSSNERQFLLEIISIIPETNAFGAVKSILQDESESDELRRMSAFALHRIADKSSLGALAVWTEQWHPQSEVLQVAKIWLLEDFMRLGIWDVHKILDNLPKEDRRHASIGLFMTLEKILDINMARKLLSTSNKAATILNDRRQRGLHDLYLKAVELLCVQDHLHDDDFNILYQLEQAEENQLVRTEDRIAQAFRKNASARRNAFLRDLTDASKRYIHFTRLLPEDIGWLTDYVRNGNSSSTILCEVLLFLARQQGVPAQQSSAATSLVEQTNPTVYKAFAEEQRKFQEQEQERRAEIARSRKEREVEPYPLKQAIEETLEKVSDLHEQMVRIGWCCSAQGNRPIDIVGKWGDLPPETCDRALQLCARALRECEPTPVPDGNSYPGRMVYEAECFERIIETKFSAYQLDGQQIRKWLPAALVFSVGAELLKTCAIADRGATEDAVLNEMRRSSRSPDKNAIIALNLEKEFWSQRLANGAIQLVADPTLHDRGRADILRSVAPNFPAIAEASARDILKTVSGGDLWMAAVNVLLMLAPEVAWTKVTECFPERGKQLLIDLTALGRISNAYGTRPDFTQWPPLVLKSLYEILHKAFPAKEDPAELGGSIDREYELRDLRDWISRMLFERGTAEDHAVLKALSKKLPRLKKIYKGWQAAENIRELFERGTIALVGEGKTSPVFPSTTKIVRVLEDSNYRIIRSNDDLLEVLVEELTEVGKSAGYHTAMLYEKVGKSKPTVPKRENALQAYIHCRLSDRLIGRVLEDGTKVEFLSNRETLTVHEGRLDIQVSAQMLNGDFATVIIETKWSKHPEVVESIQHQLGERYLVGAHQTHGIHLVAWCKSSRKFPTKNDLNKILIEKSREFEKYAKIKLGRFLRIEPIVWDVAVPGKRERSGPKR